MKRWIVFILTIVLLFPAFGLTETDYTAFDADKLQAFYEFDEVWFQLDAHVYQHPLCLASLQLAQAAFRGDDSTPDTSIHTFLYERNFQDIQIDEYADKNGQSIGSAIAHRKIGDAQLVVIAVCGGNYGPEWLSNFDVGTASAHKGFSESAEKVVLRIEEYLKQHQITNPRFWITGYSRAAAVSNLTSVYLSQRGLANDEEIFCYTFATPKTVIDPDAPLKHQNIFNIIHFADLVPHVPLASWGYDWYGKTLYLPSSLYSEIPYSDMLPAFYSAFSYLSDENTTFGIDTEMIHPAIQSGDYAYADKAYLCAKGMAISAPNPQKFQASYQQVIGKLITGEEMLMAEQMLLMTILMNAANTALKEEGIVISVTGELEEALEKLMPLAPMLLHHMPQVYAAWLISIENDGYLMNHAPTLTK